MSHILNSDDLSRVQNDLCLCVSCFQAISKPDHLGNSRPCISTCSSIHRFEAGLLMPGDYSVCVCIFSHHKPISKLCALQAILSERFEHFGPLVFQTAHFCLPKRPIKRFESVTVHQVQASFEDGLNFCTFCYCQQGAPRPGWQTGEHLTLVLSTL